MSYDTLLQFIKRALDLLSGRIIFCQNVLWNAKIANSMSRFNGRLFIKAVLTNSGTHSVKSFGL